MFHLVELLPWVSQLPSRDPSWDPKSTCVGWPIQVEELAHVFHSSGRRSRTRFPFMKDNSVSLVEFFTEIGWWPWLSKFLILGLQKVRLVFELYVFGVADSGRITRPRFPRLRKNISHSHIIVYIILHVILNATITNLAIYLFYIKLMMPFHMNIKFFNFSLEHPLTAPVVNSIHIHTLYSQGIRGKKMLCRQIYSFIHILFLIYIHINTLTHSEWFFL